MKRSLQWIIEKFSVHKKKITLGIFAVLFLWWFFPWGPEKWREQVELSDGRAIEIDRILYRQGGGGEIVENPSGTRPKEYRIKFVNPNNSKERIEWRGTKIDLVRRPEIPLVLDIEGGNPVIYTRVSIKYGDKSMYSKYVYKDGSWQEEELPEMFTEIKTNLYLGIRNRMPGFVSIKTKQNENKNSDYPKGLKQVGPKKIIP